MKVPKFIGPMVMKKEAVARRGIHDSPCAWVVSLWVKHTGLPIERNLSGVKPGVCEAWTQYGTEAEGRVGTEISTIHIGIRRVGAVVYLV